MVVKVKICGLKTKESVETAISAGADYIGCVFFEESPRNISPEEAGSITFGVSVEKIAVIVDADDNSIQRIMDNFEPNYLQLHGGESVDRADEIAKKYDVGVIKALKIRSSDDVAIAGKYHGHIDMLLFDARPWDNMPNALPGGNGISFDWQLLKDREFSVPWILSGGLSNENIEEAVKITGANIVDISSSLEIEPGKKDPQLIKEFIEKVKNI